MMRSLLDSSTMFAETPASRGYRMPAEWEPHAATWLAWPHNVGTWPEQLEQVKAIYFVREFEGDPEETERQISRSPTLQDVDPGEFRRFLDEVTPEQFAQGVVDEDDE